MCGRGFAQGIFVHHVNFPVNAICDALAEYGVLRVEMPATAERVWRMIDAAGG